VEKQIEKLRATGFKITPKIRAIINLFNEKDQYMCVQEIQDELLTIGNPLGFPTIYRILERLELAGIIFSFKNEERQIFYFLCRSNHSSHHHHFVCKMCKCVKEVSMCTFNVIQHHIETQLDAIVENHSLHIEGFCSQCKSAITN
jgi:Fur family zinc uptake transcriptional regulator